MIDPINAADHRGEKLGVDVNAFDRPNGGQLDLGECRLVGPYISDLNRFHLTELPLGTVKAASLHQGSSVETATVLTYRGAVTKARRMHLAEETAALGSPLAMRSVAVSKAAARLQACAWTKSTTDGVGR